MKIISIEAKIIADSRGQETVEATLCATEDVEIKGSVPSGQSVGQAEAKVVAPRQAVKNINEIIAPVLVGQDIANFNELDKRLVELDGTKDKSRLGANACLPVSIALIKVSAQANNLPVWKYISQLTGLTPALPTPMMVMIEGGKHSQLSGISWQEFLFNGPIVAGQDFLAKLKVVLEQKNISHQLGIEGGLTFAAPDNQTGLEIFRSILDKMASGSEYSLDLAGSHNSIDSASLNQLVKDNRLASIEDPFDQEDWSGWQRLVKKAGDRPLVVADDLIATNPDLLAQAIEFRACTGIIIKPNQIGSVSEALKVAKLARQTGLVLIASHRAGETIDSFIADLAVGLGARYLKAGAPTQPERLVKYQRLEEIREEMNEGGINGSGPI